MTELPPEESKSTASTWRPPEEDPKYVAWDAPFIRVPLRSQRSTLGFWFAVLLALSGVVIVATLLLPWMDLSFGPARVVHDGWHASLNANLNDEIVLLCFAGAVMFVCGSVTVVNPMRSLKALNGFVCVAVVAVATVALILKNLHANHLGLSAQTVNQLGDFAPRVTNDYGVWVAFVVSFIALVSAVALRRTAPRRSDERDAAPDPAGVG